MDSKSIKIAVLAVVVVLVVAAAAFVISNGGDDNGGDDVEQKTIEITQNNGKVVTVDVPVKKLCIVNTNAAEFATILGVQDRVVGVSNSMIKTPTESWWADRTDVGGYGDPSAEAILKTGATVVVGQCTSMPIKNVEALEAQGITVILLDMYGFDQQVDDLKQFAKLFPDTDAAEKAEKYGTFFNGLVETIKGKTAGIENRVSFISTMGTKADSKYYTAEAELSKLLVEICGMKNVAADLTTSSSSSAIIGEDAIVKKYNTDGIDMFILRNSTTYDKAAADIESFLSTHPIIKGEGMFDEMKIVKTVDSKVLSGPRCFIGMVYFATTVNPDIDFGMTLGSVIADYNSQFGTNWSSEKLFYEA